MARRRDDKPKRFFVPPARPTKREKNSSSGESGGTESRFWKRKEPLPTDTTWSGTADRMPANYTRNHLWNCPSCDVEPGRKHEQWCPRFLYQLNPYDAKAYDDELFLANYFDTQLYSGPGHPETEKEIKIGEYLLSCAGISKRKPQLPEDFEDWPDEDLPF